MLLIAGCIGGGGGSKASAAKAGAALEDWLRGWRGEVRFGERPNNVRIPAPPVVELPRVADDLGSDVRSAAGDFSETTGISYEESKHVFCAWFGWYVETGHAVPSEDEFPGVLLRYGFGRVLRGPPSQQFRDSVELLRKSITRAQDGDEAAANAAAAAACSL
jgi:hypothetical protein